MTNDDLSQGSMGGPTNIRRMPGKEEEIGAPQPDPGMGSKSPRADGSRPEAAASGQDTMAQPARPTLEEEGLYAHKTEEEPEARCRVCWTGLPTGSDNPLAKQVCSSECARTAAVCLLLERIADALEGKSGKKTAKF